MYLWPFMRSADASALGGTANYSAMAYQNPWLLRVFDVLSTSIGCFFVSRIYFFGGSTELDHGLAYWQLGLLVGLVFAVLNQLAGLYRYPKLIDVAHQLGGTLVNWLITWGLLAIFAFTTKIGTEFPHGAIVVLMMLGMPVLCGQRLLLKRWLVASTRKMLLEREKVAVLQMGEASEFFRSLSGEVRPATSMTLRAAAAPDEARRELRAFILDAVARKVERIIVSVPLARLADFEPIRDEFLHAPMQVIILTDNWLAETLQRPVTLANRAKGFELYRRPATAVEAGVKRAMDLVIASLALVLLLPLLLIIGLAVKLESPGPAIFRQRRLGLNDREFLILKFRSMRVMEDGDEILQARRNDDRVTEIGRFIRATSLDELPQLVNVLRGEMSIVGPRPHAIAHDEYYDAHLPNYALRRRVQPGLTGWAQVNGHRGQTSTVESMAERVKLDLWYIDNWSFRLDLWIIVRTAWELVTNRDVY